jgi:hypothetical protein
MTRTRQIRALDGSIAGAPSDPRHSRSGAASFLGSFSTPDASSGDSVALQPVRHSGRLRSAHPVTASTSARQEATINRRQTERRARTPRARASSSA